MSPECRRNTFDSSCIARFSFLVLIAASTATAQTFQDFVTRSAVVPDTQRQAVVDSFFAVSRSYPVADNDTTVFFVYQGGVSSATVPGDANNWDPSASPMTRVGGTNLWYSKRIFESDARLDYKFVVNGGTWILDPKNPSTATGGMGPNSELRMPKYVSAPEILYYPNIPHGTLHDTTYTSAALGNSRTVRVYTPPAYKSSHDSLPVILFHDGLEYVTLAQANNIIDYLIWKGHIRPIIAVFVPPVNRTPEYVSTQIAAFSAFIATELMPSIDAHYRTRRDPASRAVLEASNGGNISLWLGFNYPGSFGMVGAQSSYIHPSLFDGFQSSAKLKLKLYLDLGTYDIPQLIPMVRSFVPILQSKGYSVRYREYHEGHSWGNWRAHLAGALEFFFGNPSTGMLDSPALPEELKLQQTKSMILLR